MNALIRPLSMLALLALPLAAQPRPEAGFRVERMSRALNLSDAQKASLRAIREKHRPDLILRRDAVAHARIDLRTALQEPATPEARLRALYDKASAARFELILAQRATRLEVRALLTPEQLAKVAELRGLARERFRERLRPMRGPAGIPG